MSSKQKIKSAFKSAQHDSAEPVDLPNGATCYMKPLSIDDVRGIEDAQDPATGRVDLSFVFEKIFGSLHVEPNGERVFSDGEIDDLLEMPFNHPLMASLISTFNDVNDMSLEVLGANAASVEHEGVEAGAGDAEDTSDEERNEAVEQLKA